MIQDERDLDEALSVMREANTDLANYEIKEAKGGFPSSVVESMVAFANTAGGTVILGVSEKNFRAVDIDVRKVQNALSNAARNQIVG